MKNKNLIGVSGKKRSGKNTVASIIQYLIWKNKVEEGSITSLNWTLKDFLDNRPPSIYEEKSFAGKLKQIVSLLTGVPVEDLEKEEVKNSTLPEEWWKYKRSDGNVFREITKEDYLKLPNDIKNSKNIVVIKPTYRQVLQQLGTDLLRNQLHPNVHINSLFADYKEKLVLTDDDKEKFWTEKVEEKYDYPSWILTDMRFPNELEAIQERNGITIRVERDTELRFPELWSKFQTQNEYDTWDDFLKSIGEYNTIYHSSETGLDNVTTWDYVIENNSDLDDLVKKVEDILKKEEII